MAKQRYLNTRFWSDNYISNLDSSEKLLFIYCLTNQYTDICGIYEIPLKTIAFETELDMEIIKKALGKFAQDKKIAHIDGWMYVCNWTKHQMCNKSIELGMHRAFCAIPDEIKAKIEQFNIGYTQSDTSLGTESTLLRLIPILKPSGISCSPSVSEIEQITNLTNNKKETTPKNAQKKKTEVLMNINDFNTFWDAYPRRIGKKRVQDIFLRIGKNVLPAILRAVEQQKKSVQWQNPQYIPHPSTWLNQGRWEDEEVSLTLEQEVKNLLLECKNTYKENGENVAFFRWKDICEERGLNIQNFARFFPEVY